MNTRPVPLAEFSSVPFTCELCGKPGAARFWRECPQEWLEKLHPMLVHNACHDANRGFRRAEEAIGNACMEIYLRTSGSDRLDRALDGMAKRYAEMFARRHGTPMVFSSDFTEMLRARPGDVAKILHQYGKQVRAMQPELSPESGIERRKHDERAEG